MSKRTVLSSLKKQRPRSSNRSWKRYQQDSISRQKVLLGLGVLAVLIGVILVGKTLNFIGSLTKPFSSVAGQTKSYSWDGKANLNLVIKGKSVDFLSYNPQAGTVTHVKFPDETYLKIPGYGSWQVRSVYELGQSEKVPVGGALLKSSIGSVVGTPINGFLVTKGGLAERSTPELLEEIRGSPISFVSLFQNSTTDLSFLELVRFWWEVREVRFDKINTIDLAQSPVTSWEILSDGTRVLTVDGMLLDQTLRGLFEESSLTEERETIAILNSTDYPQLAERGARVVGNLGGRVVETGTLEGDPQPTTVVIGNQTSSSSRLKQIFSPGCQPQKILMLTLQDSCAKIVADLVKEKTELQDLSERADIIVVLGEDFGP